MSLQLTLWVYANVGVELGLRKGIDSPPTYYPSEHSAKN